MKSTLFIFFICLSLFTQASNDLSANSYFNHLFKINKEWKHHKDVCPNKIISFNSDEDRIKLHLTLVINHLKNNKPSHINSTQLTKRISLLNELQKYADKKIFPLNKYHNVRQPYFVDKHGTHCAVGQMISISGHKKLVTEIAKNHNYDYITNIKIEGINEWANEFGFTIAELMWIQPGYLPTTHIEQVLDGTNGSVKKIINKNSDQSLILVGDFTELNGLPCLNIGVYKNNQLNCLGSGIEGVINDVFIQSDDIYVFGELRHNGQNFPAAIYNGFVWEFVSIPNRDGAICTSANGNGPGFLFEMAINHNFINQGQEIWQYSNQNLWIKKANVNGTVLVILTSPYGRVYAGHFDQLTTFQSNFIIDETINVNNVVLYSAYTDLWTSLGSNISDTVKVVKNIGNSLIFGGSCINSSGASNVCISRYYNSVLQPLYLNNSETENNSINSIAYDNGNEFTFGGNFQISPMAGTLGRNLATYNLVNNRIEAIAIFDEPVKSLTYLNNQLYIGGDFQTNLYTENINHLGRISETNQISEFQNQLELIISPNPFTEVIYLNGIEEGTLYSILNINGSLIQTGLIKNEKIEGLENLPTGCYILQLETKTGLVVKKIFK